jgi:formylglycine-generating enzyme required for sulfatase activity
VSGIDTSYNYNNDLDGFSTPAPPTHAAINVWAAFNNPPKTFRESGSDWPINYSWTDYEKDPRAVPERPLEYAPTKMPLLTINEAANGYRLPSLNHWRWAAMGADMSPSKLVNGVNNPDWAKPFSGYNGYNNVADYVWFNDSRTSVTGGDGAFEVAKKKPNELGIYDMNGNVAEWVWDPMDGLNTRSLWPYPMIDTETAWYGFYQWFGSQDRLLLGGWTEDSMPRMTLSFWNWRNSDHDRQGPDTGVDGVLSGTKDQGFRVMRLVQPGE